MTILLLTLGGCLISFWAGVVVMGALCANTRRAAEDEAYSQGYRNGKAMVRAIAGNESFKTAEHLN